MGDPIDALPPPGLDRARAATWRSKRKPRSKKDENPVADDAWIHELGYFQLDRRGADADLTSTTWPNYCEELCSVPVIDYRDKAVSDPALRGRCRPQGARVSCCIDPWMTAGSFKRDATEVPYCMAGDGASRRRARFAGRTEHCALRIRAGRRRAAQRPGLGRSRAQSVPTVVTSQRRICSTASSVCPSAIASTSHTSQRTSPSPR